MAVGKGNRLVDGDYSIITATSDGGRSWSGLNGHCAGYYPSLNELYSVDCDNTGRECVAVGTCALGLDYHTINLSYFTKDGGDTWYLSRGPARLQSRYNLLNTVTCKNTSCDATGTASDGETTWKTAYHSDNVGVDWIQTNQ